jgi:hypothetical protein
MTTSKATSTQYVRLLGRVVVRRSAHLREVYCVPKQFFLPYASAKLASQQTTKYRSHRPVDRVGSATISQVGSYTLFFTLDMRVESRE